MIATTDSKIDRVRITLRGAVQGVGFRPFVYRLAGQLGIRGWVRNSSEGLVIEAEGDEAQLHRFLARLESDRPAAAVVIQTQTTRLNPAGDERFEIIASTASAQKVTSILPDLATCKDCLAELTDHSNPRIHYAFTNCTHCGPRFTIVEDIPYDRTRTTMRGFTMCAECEREYNDPEDRRFHAQPNACPRCGPRLWLEHSKGSAEARSGMLSREPFSEAAQVLRQGGIVALKGIGGFQLLVDAREPRAVERLRKRKRREAKPLAVMMPSLEMVRRYCEVSPDEQRLLESPAAPIVLLKPNGAGKLADNVAGVSPYLGVMLPYSPLHYLLLSEFPFPVVATSGNSTEEPIAISNDEARARLGEIADLFVMHDRPIARPCDDSVVRLVRGRGSVIRRARGYAPLPVFVGKSLPPVLAVGGHLKNTIAIAIGQQVFLSQHVGDLDTLEARAAFERAIEDMCRLYDFEPRLVACDLHPDYASTLWAQACGLPVVGVQHHHAHVAACAAEQGIKDAYLGVSWDGTGYGLDGTIWGGEFFLVQGGRFERVAHLRPFRLPGGEAAVRECWRSAVSLLREAGGSAWPVQFPGEGILQRMLERGVNSPWTTSVGRLFDGIAAIAGVVRTNLFEGQAAMQLEQTTNSFVTNRSYTLTSNSGVGDWGSLIEEVCRDMKRRESPGLISAKFHNALVDWILAVAEQVGVHQVILSGGVFQNGYLVGRSAARLEERGYRVYTHRQVPPNDGGIALGQAILAASREQGA